MNKMYLNMLVKFQDLSSREDGQDMVEYGLMLALVATAVAGVSTSVSSIVTALFTKVATMVSTNSAL